MKNMKDFLKKKHSKKEHDAHLNDEKKLDPTSVRQEERGQVRNGEHGGRCGQRWYPQNPHKKGRS